MMRKTTLILLAGFLTLLCGLTFAQNTKLNLATHPSIDELKSRFADPGRDYATAPLWVWNDLLTDDQIRQTMRDLAAQDVKQVFVHPRPGLMTPYLSDDWFHLWRTALDEAEKLDMNVWIYDENSYPTGFAGGLVPEAMPESRGKGLSVFRRDALTDANGNWTAGPDVVYVVQVLGDGSKKDLSALYQQTKTGKLADEFLKGKADGVTWILGEYKWAGASQWYGGMYYVDLMKPGVTEKFIEVTRSLTRRTKSTSATSSASAAPAFSPTRRRSPPPGICPGRTICRKSLKRCTGTASWKISKASRRRRATGAACGTTTTRRSASSSPSVGAGRSTSGARPTGCSGRGTTGSTNGPELPTRRITWRCTSGISARRSTC